MIQFGVFFYSLCFFRFLLQIFFDKGAFSWIQSIGYGKRGGFGQHVESCYA